MDGLTLQAVLHADRRGRRRLLLHAWRRGGLCFREGWQNRLAIRHDARNSRFSLLHVQLLAPPNRRHDLCCHGQRHQRDKARLSTPKAPAFAALDKGPANCCGRVICPAENIIQGQWSNPVLREVSGKPQVIFPGGDGWLYALEPKTGKPIWQFKCSPTQTKDDRGIPHYIVATPVVQDNRLYIAVGAYRGATNRLRGSAISSAWISPRAAMCRARTRTSTPRSGKHGFGAALALRRARGSTRRPRPGGSTLGSSASTAAI